MNQWVSPPVNNSRVVASRSLSISISGIRNVQWKYFLLFQVERVDLSNAIVSNNENGTIGAKSEPWCIGVPRDALESSDFFDFVIENANAENFLARVEVEVSTVQRPSPQIVFGFYFS